MAAPSICVLETPPGTPRQAALCPFKPALVALQAVAQACSVAPVPRVVAAATCRCLWAARQAAQTAWRSLVAPCVWRQGTHAVLAPLLGL